MPRLPLLAFLLPALLLSAPLGGAESPSFSGVIELTESITAAEPTSGEDRIELDRYRELTEARLRQARSDLSGAPPVIARTLHQDIDLWQSELERVVVVRGGELALGTLHFQLSNGRVAFSAPDMRYRIDRLRGIAQSLSAEGTVSELTPAPLPAIDSSNGEPGPMILGRSTVRYRRTILGREHEILMSGDDLPNVCAQSLIRGATDSDLFQTVATLPGLPLRIEIRDGRVIRRIAVTRIEPGAVADDAFTPWK